MSAQLTTGCGCGNCSGTCGGACGGPAGAALERARYFPRQLVTANDLTQDQRYFRDRLRRHNRLLHGWGVVCGARVRAVKDSCTVVIEPGYLLGPHGDEIVIDKEVTVDLCREGPDGTAVDPCADLIDPWCANIRVNRPDGQVLYLAVRYDECPTRPVRTPAGGCGPDFTCEYTRVRDGYAVKVLTELPASYAKLRPGPDWRPFFGADADDRRPSRCGVPCPPCPDEPWVLLADVVLQGGRVVFVDCFNNRRYVAAFGEFYWLCPPTAPGVVALTVDPNKVIAGRPATGRLTLAAPAPAGGVTVNLASGNTAMATVPGSVFVPQGQKTGDFPVSSVQKHEGDVELSAVVEDGVPAKTKLRLVVLKAITPATRDLAYGTTATMSVQLSEPAPAGGAQVALKSDNTQAATVPPVANLAAGATTGDFVVTAASNLGENEVRETKIRARLEGVDVSAAVRVIGPVIR